MRKSATLSTCIILFWHVILLAQTGGIVNQLLRPIYIDTISSQSQGAVLMSLSEYPAESVKYRLFNESAQHYCWNSLTNAFVSSTSYTNAPISPGSPGIFTKFWIIFQRGSNNSSIANYRDRIDPYTVNNNTCTLSRAIGIKFPYELSGILTGNDLNDLTVKYVVLAYSENDLISSSSSDLETGDFTIVIPLEIGIDKIEIRTIADEIVGKKNGNWNHTTFTGEIVLENISGIPRENHSMISIYPIPASEVLYIKGLKDTRLIEMMDIYGKILKSVKIEEDETLINISDLEIGIYFIRAGGLTEMFIKR